MSLSARRAQMLVMEEFGIALRTAQRNIQQVKERWAEEALASHAANRDARRDNIRSFYENVIRICLARQRDVKGPDGSVLRDPDTGMPIKEPHPDMHRAMYAVGQLRKLDGLDVPVKAVVEHTGGVGMAHGVDVTDREGLELLLKGLTAKETK